MPILTGSDTGNVSTFPHGRRHGEEAESFVTEIGMTPMEAIVANTSGSTAIVNLAGQVGVIASGKLGGVRLDAKGGKTETPQRNEAATRLLLAQNAMIASCSACALE